MVLESHSLGGGGEAQAAKVIGGELYAAETDGAAQSEADAGQVAAIGNEREFGEGNIETCRGKARCKSPYLACQLLVFFAPIRYRAVTMGHSYFKVVLRTMKHTIVYPSSAPSSEVITLCLAV
jgi:hypothetical protein